MDKSLRHYNVRVYDLNNIIIKKILRYVHEEKNDFERVVQISIQYSFTAVIDEQKIAGRHENGK